MKITRNNKFTAHVEASSMNDIMFFLLLFFLIAPVGYRVNVTANFLFEMAYLSVLSGAVYFLLWNAIARLHKVGKTSTLIYLTPVTVTIVQYVETSLLPPSVSLIGICLMIIGISISRF